MNDPELYLSAIPSVTADITNLLQQLSQTKRLGWSDNERILDVGSGPGSITNSILLSFLPEDATVVGLDISQEMVNYANRVNASERISYRVQDISVPLNNSSHWKAETFNKIFSFYCLHLVSNLDLVAKNFYYLMKPGGYLVTHFCVTSPFNTVREVLSKQAKWKHYLKNDEDMSICSMDSAEDPCAYYSNFLKDAGFQEISCQTDTFTHKFENMDQVIRLCKSITPFLKRIPTSEMEDYLIDLGKVMERINEVKISENGEVYVTWLNMITIAKKK